MSSTQLTVMSSLVETGQKENVEIVNTDCVAKSLILFRFVVKKLNYNEAELRDELKTTGLARRCFTGFAQSHQSVFSNL